MYLQSVRQNVLTARCSVLHGRCCHCVAECVAYCDAICVAICCEMCHSLLQRVLSLRGLVHCILCCDM